MLSLGSETVSGTARHLAFSAKSNQIQKCHKNSREPLGPPLINRTILTEFPSKYKEPFHTSWDLNLLFHGCQAYPKKINIQITTLGLLAEIFLLQLRLNGTEAKADLLLPQTHT